jgi:hypothetical protein
MAEVNLVGEAAKSDQFGGSRPSDEASALNRA